MAKRPKMMFKKTKEKKPKNAEIKKIILNKNLDKLSIIK